MVNHFEIILNPTAGKGNARERIPVIESFMRTHNLPYTLHLTERAGHAIEIAETLAANNKHAVIAAGGDGTCNEVINGLMHAAQQADGSSDHELLMGVLPIGRGNDFCYGAGLPTDLESSLQILTGWKLKPIDIGLIQGGDYPEGRYFGNGIGVGFDTIVGLEAAKMKHIHGAAGYALGAIKTIITYPKAPELDISFNGKLLKKTPALVSIMNGRRMGGAFFMAPNGDNTDGLLNICMTDQGPRRRLLKALVHYTKGTQAGLPDTETDKSADIELTARSGSMAIHADGETICTDGKHVTVHCIPKSITLLTPKDEK